MIRFKVIRGSRLLLLLAAVILAAVLAVLLISARSQSRQPSIMTNADLVQSSDIERPDKETALAVSSLRDNPKAVMQKDLPSIEVTVLSDSPTSAPGAKRFSVLIYHTHTHEAYDQDKADPYDAIEAWRTMDADHSVVRVGAELAKALRQRGLEVVHDTTDHEKNELSTAYTRSLETLEGYLRTFDLYIDLHRDAYVKGETLAHNDSTGEPKAKLMCLIGNGNGFEVKPDTSANYAYARLLTEAINRLVPGLCKPVLVKDGRYNQHVGHRCILVEVGHNRNTLQEALASIPVLAEAIDKTLSEAMMDEGPLTANAGSRSGAGAR